MQLGHVIGTATSTVKHPTFQGERLLVVQLEGPDGTPDGEPVLAFDRLGAGRGDVVLVTTDGLTLQEQLGPTTPGRWSVLGLPDGFVLGADRRVLSEFHDSSPAQSRTDQRAD